MAISDPNQLNGRTVIGADGEKIGTVEDIYLDAHSNRPEWVAIKTGWFGRNISLVPIGQASEVGGDLQVPFEKDRVSSAPHQDPGQDISEMDEEGLYRHYGLSYGTGGGGTAYEGGYTDLTPSAVDASSPAATGEDTAGGDEAMTRSEERLHVSKEQAPVGRARLRKYVVTENVQQTVPVSHEEVRLEREPINEANQDAAYSGPEISEAEHEVTLHEERPVVKKETAPVERVRLGKDVHTEEAQVSEDVRREEVDLQREGRSQQSS